MLEAKELNKIKVGIISGEKEVEYYFTEMKNALNFLNEGASQSKEGFDGDSIKIDKLVPMDYFPSEFTNSDSLTENLWMGEFVHFHDLPNSQNVPGTLYTRRFILLMYTNEFNPNCRDSKNYVAHMFLPKLAKEPYDLEYTEYLHELGPISLTIHATDRNYDDIGIVSNTILPLYELYNEANKINSNATDKFIESIMNCHIQQFADMYNPYLYLKTIKPAE